MYGTNLSISLLFFQDVRALIPLQSKALKTLGHDIRPKFTTIASKLTARARSKYAEGRALLV